MAYQITYDGNIGALPVPATMYSSASIYTGNSITGTRSIFLNSSAYIYLPFSTSTSTPAISLWVYLQHDAWAYANGYSRIQFRTTSGEYVGLYFNVTNKTYDLYINGVLAEAGTVYLENQSIFNVRMYGTIADSGSITVKINGVTSISYSGDTKPGTDATVDRLDLQTTRSNVPGSASYAFFSSISLNDGGTDPGDRRAQVLMPNGDSSVQWTPSAGTVNYALVDEVPPSSTDYLETSTNGYTDLLTLEDFTGTGRTIAGVTKFVQAWKTTADAQSLNNGVYSGTAESYTEHELETSAKYYFHAMGTNPDDSAAWEDGDIDGLLTLHEAVIP